MYPEHVSLAIPWLFREEQLPGGLEHLEVVGLLKCCKTILSCFVRVDGVLCTELAECHFRQLISGYWILDLLYDFVRLLKALVELGALVVVLAVAVFFDYLLYELLWRASTFTAPLSEVSAQAARYLLQVLLLLHSFHLVQLDLILKLGVTLGPCALFPPLLKEPVCLGVTSDLAVGGNEDPAQVSLDVLGHQVLVPSERQLQFLEGLSTAASDMRP